MNNPLVSIFIPVYNASKYLNKCLDSVFNQTYKNIEVLTYLDSASSDDSCKILEEYASKYPNMYIKERIHGDNRIIERFVKECHGDYIVQIDNDDYVELDMIERVMDTFMSNEDVDTVIFNYKYIDDDGNLLPWKLPQLDNKIVSNREAVSDFLTSVNIEGFRWNKVFKKEVLKDFVFETTFPGDMPSIFNLLMDRCKKIAYLDYYPYYYRQREGSQVSTFNINNRIDFLISYRNIANKAKANGFIKESEYYLVHSYVGSMYSNVKDRKKITYEQYSSLMEVGSWNTYLNMSLFKALSILNKKACKDSRLKMAIKAIIVYNYTKEHK